MEQTNTVNNYAEGGPKMLDLKTFSRSLKFTWIQKYLSSQSNAKWKTFFDYRLRRNGGSSSSNLYFARVIPSIQTVLLSIGALEFKNLQYTFKNLLQPIYKMQDTFTNI